MGLDYRYLLFFERDARLDALEHLGRMGDAGSEHHTTLRRPERTVELPFEPWCGTGAEIAWDDASPTWSFMTVLGFEPDEPIIGYLERMGRIRGGAAGPDDDLLDPRGLAPIGIVYLTVHHDMTDWPSGTGDDLVLFELGTPGSSMSVLFSESGSIRRALVGLLASCRGVYGLLDYEDWADVFWWRGRETDLRIPTAELPLAEIEVLLGRRV